MHYMVQNNNARSFLKELDNDDQTASAVAGS